MTEEPRDYIKVLGLDPGKQRDSFALVSTKSYQGDYYVMNAQRFLGRNYLDVEENIKIIHEKANYDSIILELNNTGFHVYDVLTMKMGLPVKGVYTSKELKDTEKKRGYDLMDKNEMVRNMIHWFQNSLENKHPMIIFPKNSNDELNELKRQLSIFAEHKTEAGNVSYYAEGSEHDDLVMALMLTLWWIRNLDYSSIGITHDGRIMKPKVERPNKGLQLKTEVVE